MKTLAHRHDEASGAHELSIRNLHAHYGKVCALRGINIDLRCGRSVALVGGNGAGKTTLMKSIIGILPARSGEVLWMGRPVRHCTTDMAYLPQRQNLDWQFPITVRALVETGRYPYLGLWKPMRAEDRQAVDTALRTMRIENLAARQIGALSGGQQQRAFIARALAQKAHVLLLDEPFAGLDQPSSDILAELLSELTRRGTLVIASHHELGSISDIYDEVILLNRRLIAQGPVDEVMTKERIEEAFGR
jgi:ABC-type Mn2+/Zn2+ transport system ATPase subunit